MKNRIFSILVASLSVLAGCAGVHGGQSPLPDSTYAWENIRQYMMEDPEYALSLIDTAQTRGIADENLANHMRAQVYYGSQKAQDIDKARDCCLQVLENRTPEADSLQKMNTLALLVAVYSTSQDTYQDAIQYAMQGAGMAHHAGNSVLEARFYSDAGLLMEHLQQGGGMDYMNRSLHILREASRSDISILPVLSSSIGSMCRILAGQESYAAVVPLLQERLQVIARVEKEIPTAPAGWADQQRAYTYPVLAYCQHVTGDKAGARRTAEAFERTAAARWPERMLDMMNYYALVGNARRIQESYDFLEPYYRETEDTISRSYASLLNIYATGLDNIGRGHEAYQAQYRYQAINDSLVQRERRFLTLEYAQQMKTQEKEMQLKDEEARTKVYRILALSLTLLLLVIVIALWRLALAHRELLRKNRELYQQFARNKEKEQENLEQLESQPAEERTPAQQLFLRLVELMRKEEPYTDPSLNRDMLASMLATNHRYIDEAIRACSDCPSTGAFINSYRVDHAARLLSQTDEPVNMIAEMSGFNSRTHFNERFRERFKMTPSEFRRASGK